MGRRTMRYILSIAAFLIAAVNAKAAAEGVSDSLRICAAVIIPSLFPLMFLTMYLIKNGTAAQIGRLTAGPCEKILGLPGAAGFAVICALTGGYPAGAAAVKTMYEKGVLSREQAQRTIYFAVSAGPSFILGAIGNGIYNNSMAGLLLFAAQTISVLLMAIIVCLPHRKGYVPMCSNLAEAEDDSALTESVSEAASSLLSVCAFIMAFGAINGILENTGVLSFAGKCLSSLGFSQNTSAALPIVLTEVSAGCIEAAHSGLPLVAFAVGFGGLSVHFQIYSLIRSLEISKLKFTLYRLLQGLICSGLTAVMMPLLPENAVPAMAMTGQSAVMNSAAGSVCLVVMCFMAVLCISGENDAIFRKKA